MKILKKMLLINWYYIGHQIINFDSTNFMTGKNASGKSTIIDAMQIVMLGDTRGTFFNKASNDKRGRTLDGYLRGEITDKGESEMETVRTGRFSSYIALEFFDTVERKSFTCGIVFDSYKDAATDHMFFILQDAIPEEHFFAEGTKKPMSYKELKSYFATNYPAGKFKTYKESNKTYQVDLLSKMGGLKPKFFSLFKKSVSFIPISDIEQFISEYVCDVTDEINVEKMQENIRNYKQLEKDAIIMQKRQQKLENIEELFNSYQIDIQKEYMQKFLAQKSLVQLETNKFKDTKNKFKENLEKINKLKSEINEIEIKKKELLNLQDQKKIEVNTSDIGQKQKQLQDKLNFIQNQLKYINSKTEDLIDNFRNKIAKWRVNIKELLEQRKYILEPKILEILNVLKDNIEYLLSISENNIETLEEQALIEIKEQMENINEYANNVYSKNEIEKDKLIEKQDRLSNEIKNLKVGIKPYDAELLEFKNELTKELSAKFNVNVEVEILADLLEIGNLEWKEAIECYINYQMFYLIIDPKYYSEAAKIYRKIAQNGKYEGIGIIDIEKIQKKNYVCEKNSLAEEIRTDNPFSKVYIEYLLGRVIKCEDIDEMRKYKSAITKDCMLYKNFVLKKIADKYNKFKFIGSKSIAEQIKLKKEEVNEILSSLTDIEKIINITKELKNADRFSDREIEYIMEDSKRVKEKPELIKESQKIEQELNSLDLSWIKKIEEEINNLGAEIEKLNKKRDDKYGEQKSLETTNTNIQEDKIPMYEKNIDIREKELKDLFSEEWIISFGNPRFEKEIENQRIEKVQKRAEEQIEIIKEQKNRKEEKLINARAEYTKEYNFGYDITNRNANEEFSKDLQEIKEVTLPQYIDKIRDSKEKAYEQFRDDFISKLKANIDEVENQIEELNAALKDSTFGTDKYHFTVKAKQEYKRFYDMIKDNMLMEGKNLWSEQFNQRYKDEIKELFEKLTSSDINDGTYNKNIAIYTDYKTYLSFDLIVTDKEGRTQHLSRTLNKKSGGEVQTPFYISILASFAQLYRINKNRNDNTLRLVVFDEAFNRMDEDRIEESLKLLSKFGFQAIVAAPTEKLGQITPLVSNTLCVIRKGTRTVVNEWGIDKNYLG